MVFVVLEGFSGSGKTTVAKLLSRNGWKAITESAHSVPETVQLADRGDTYSDYSLLGATLLSTYEIAHSRKSMNIVAEGYFISDLAYARIRYEKGLSNAYPLLKDFVFSLLEDRSLLPDIFVVLEASKETLQSRQSLKSERDKNLSSYFMERYYKLVYSFHRGMGHVFTKLSTEEREEETAEKIVDMVEKL